MNHIPSYSIPAIIILWMSIFLCSCGPVDAEETLQQAESDLQYGHYEKAATSCDLLADSSTTLSSTQLCRVAIMYAKISEKSEKEDYMASAARCFDRAVDMNNDSIEQYIESLNLEDQSYVRVIREVTRALKSPCDVSRENDDEDFCGDTVTPDEISTKPTASL